MDNRNNHEAARGVAAAFAESFGKSLSQSIGSPWSLAILDNPDLTTRQGQSVHFRLTMDGALRGDCFVEFYEPYVAELGSKILGEGTSDYSARHKDALAKAIIAAMPAVSASLSGQAGAVSIQVNPVEGLAFGGMFVVPLSAAGSTGEELPIMLYFDAPLLAALNAQRSASDSGQGDARAFDASNLKLVMDVELNVSLRFGQRQLPLREVLGLASGSVVELDREVDEPVELLLDGKVIARGEAVIVDGNYGLRVTEIPQPIASHFVRR
ncbi:MAG TPA: flagellar motor switch protein FliN [Acidobacteriaceae bacterium]|jgi:flagellar motor switch protein FliN/FliY|nr:flagellar motor switch protein FliN [Acidobacteriaceae bacterium]